MCSRSGTTSPGPRRVVQPINDVKALPQAPASKLRREPGARLAIPVMVVKYEEIPDRDPAPTQCAEIADAIRLPRDRLRNAAAQDYARVCSEIGQRGIKGRPADVVEIDVDPVFAFASDSRCQIILGLVINYTVKAECVT